MKRMLNGDAVSPSPAAPSSMATRKNDGEPTYEECEHV